MAVSLIKKSALKPVLKYLKVLLFGNVVRFGFRNKMQEDVTRLTIIAPHPDDEIFGLGGYLSGLRPHLHRIHIIYLTDGEASLPGIPPEEIARVRTDLSVRVMQTLGIGPAQISRLHLPDGCVPGRSREGFEEAVGRIRELIAGFEPEAVFVTHPADTWPFDHAAAFEITEQALRELGFKGSLYGYWVWLWYNYPLHRIGKIDRYHTYKIPIRDNRSKKKELIGIYMNSCTPSGNPYSGILPDAFMRAFSFPFEMVTRLNIAD